MRLTWIIPVGPKSDDKCPYKRQKRKSHVTTEAEMGRCGHEPRTTQNPQKLEGAGRTPALHSLQRELPVGDNLLK